jgi:division protein CdvB (Snf7/Vps24/ESCRT-III family)
MRKNMTKILLTFTFALILSMPFTAKAEMSMDAMKEAATAAGAQIKDAATDAAIEEAKTQANEAIDAAVGQATEVAAEQAAEQAKEEAQGIATDRMAAELNKLVPAAGAPKEEKKEWYKFW